MNNPNPHSVALTFKNIDLDLISTIKKAIASAKRLKATTDKKSDTYITSEIAELIRELNELKTGVGKYMVRTVEHNWSAAALEKTQINKCFAIPKEQIICSICLPDKRPGLIDAE